MLTVDAPYRFVLYPYNGTEVFDHYDRVTIAVFARLSIDAFVDHLVVEQFDVRPSDWDDWREDIGLSPVTTQSTETAVAQTAPIMGVAVAAGSAAAVGVIAGRRLSAPGNRG